MFFTDIVGQEQVKKHLINTVKNNRISHAQLFLGQEGCGNLALAVAYAKYIMCENKKDTDACGECSACKKNNKLVHPDLHFIYPVAKTAAHIKYFKSQNPVSEHFISDFRQIFLQNSYMNLYDWYRHIDIEKKQALITTEDGNQIVKKFSIKSYESRYKIMIIWMPEKMHNRAANKLLKILEEPPVDSFFFLVANDHFQILPTILSRTQIVKVPRVDDSSIRQYLQQNTQHAEDKINEMVFVADGSISKMQKALNEDSENAFDWFKGWMRICYTGNAIHIFDVSEAFVKNTREKQKKMLGYATDMIRQALLLNNQQSLCRLGKTEKAFLKGFAPYIKNEALSNIMVEIDRAVMHIERNVNSQLVFSDLSFKLNSLIKR